MPRLNDDYSISRTEEEQQQIKNTAKLLRLNIFINVKQHTIARLVEQQKDGEQERKPLQDARAELALLVAEQQSLQSCNVQAATDTKLIANRIAYRATNSDERAALRAALKAYKEAHSGVSFSFHHRLADKKKIDEFVTNLAKESPQEIIRNVASLLRDKQEMDNYGGFSKKSFCTFLLVEMEVLLLKKKNQSKPEDEKLSANQLRLKEMDIRQNLPSARNEFVGQICNDLDDMYSQQHGVSRSVAPASIVETSNSRDSLRRSAG